jgi:hypothetical protein
MLTLDSACKRNRFSGWTLNSSLANEVTNSAADANDNTGSFYDIQNSVQYYLGKHLTRTTPTYGASVAINASLGDLFDITATNRTAFTVAIRRARPMGSASPSRSGTRAVAHSGR